ncbi:MAG: Trk system potassium transporter TrkA [Thermodesulfobacteriota bacterium]
MSIIIIGAGEVGYHLAQRLSQEKQDVVVIDRDPEKIRRIQNSLDVQAIHGSGGSISLLRQAGIAEASLLIAVTNSDEINMISCLVAGLQNKVLRKIARVRDPDYSAFLPLFDKDHLDIDLVINPDREVVDMILKLMEAPGAVRVADFADGLVRMVGLPIQEGNPLIGNSLGEIHRKYPKANTLIVAIQRGGKIFIPKGDDVLQAQDIVFSVCARDEVKETIEILGNKRRTIKKVMILGGGLIGLQLALGLESQDIQVKVIEQGEARCLEIAEKCHKVVVLKPDGVLQDVMIEENIGEMDTFIAVTEDEESNVMLSLLAKKLGTKRVITLINKVVYSPLVHSLGIDVVVSPRLAALNRILQFLRRGKILSVSTLPDENAEAFEAVALETSDLVGRPLKDLNFPKEAIIGAVVRDSQVIIPGGKTVIRPGDRVTIFTLTSAIPKVEKALTVKLEYW